MDRATKPEAYVVPVPPPSGDDVEFDLRDLLRRLWRHKWLIIAIVLLVLGPTWLVVQQLTPRYTATAMVLIEPPDYSVVDLEAVVAGLSTDPETVHGELIVLQSRELAEKAVERLGLFDSPDLIAPRRKAKPFLTHLNPFTYLPELAPEDLLPEAWRESLFGPKEPPRVLSDDELRQRARDAVIGRFRAGLGVATKRRTRVVDVSYTSEDPKFTARAANALAEVYVLNTLEVKFAGTREATTWLNERLADLRKNVEKSEQAVERHRREARLIAGGATTLVAEQASAVNAQLIAARAETAQAEARYLQAVSLINSKHDGNAITAVLTSPLIQSLRQQESSLVRKSAELSIEYGEKHPRMINIRAEITDIQANIQAEFQQVVAVMRNEMEIARVRQREFDASLKQLTANVGELNQAEVKLRALQREADANRLLFETFLTRYKETSIQQDFQQPDARIISAARVPGSPSYPQKRSIIIRAFVVSVGLGLALVFVMEKLDKGFRTARQLEAKTGLRTLGLIPLVGSFGGRTASPQDQILNSPSSRYSEAIRMLLSNLAWIGDGRAPKTLLITSAVPREGKTATADSLVRMAARLEQRVLLIDCDLRRPFAARSLGLRSSPGLAEVLRGDAQPYEVIQKDRSSGADFIAAGRLPDDPAKMLKAETLRPLLAQLQQTYDLIIFDSSPVLAVTEPRLLAHIVDRTILLVRWGHTPREVVQSALKQLLDTGAAIDGLVLTQVNMTKQAQYGYGEYGYYSNYAKHYYVE